MVETLKKARQNALTYYPECQQRPCGRADDDGYVLRMENMKLSAIVGIIMLVLFNFSFGDEAPSANRPAHWAQPMQVDGVPNLHKVSDSLYRSAQPSAEGMANLKAMGIVTVVNLRSFHCDRDGIGEHRDCL